MDPISAAASPAGELSKTVRICLSGCKNVHKQTNTIMTGGDKTMEKICSLDDLPVVLNANQVASVLGIARSSAYILMHSEDFPSFRIGKSLRVNRDRFISWMDGQT